MTIHRVSIAGGASFDCSDTDNLVAAAEKAGWALPASCRAGICGTCEGGIEQGAFVVPGRNGEGPVFEGRADAVRLCRARPRSDMTIVPRDVKPVEAASLEPLVAKVLRIDRIASEVAILKLRFPAGKRAAFKAGQYLKIILDDGAERCFSMANPPQSNDGVELHVRQMPGGRFSDAVFNSMKVGDTVKLRLPQGDFWLRDTDRPIVFVAGGTGFAPVQSMVEDMLRRRIGRPAHVYFGSRTAELLYRDAVASQWPGRRAELSYVPVVSSPVDGDGWTGRTGLVHEAVVRDLPALEAFEVYACGAPGMVAAARDTFVQHGLMPSNFFCDAFASSNELET